MGNISSVLVLICLYTGVLAQIAFQNYTRTLHSSGRHLVHMHIESAEVFGNTTGLMYYFANVYVGSHENPSKQALILDTGSGIT